MPSWRDPVICTCIDEIMHLGRQKGKVLMNIDFNQMIFALSDTLDLVGIDDVQHGKRVGYMVWECATLMGFDHPHQKDLFHMGLLHDCGV